MAIEYKWIFNAIKVKPIDGNLNNVVVSYEWRRAAKDGDYFVDCYGSISLTDPDPDNFTEFQDLTEQDLAAWAIAALSPDTVASYDSSLANQLELLKNPPTVIKPAPWENIP
jgi:hypothetical protein